MYKIYVDGEIVFISLNVYEAMNKAIELTKKKMKGFSKNLTKIQNWSTLKNSSLIGKGVGAPKEKYTFLDQLSKSETSMLYKVKLKKTGELLFIGIII